MVGAEVSEFVLLPPATPHSAPVYRIDPLRDLRWAALVEQRPQSSVFHSAPWIEALRRTYGFEPVVFTTSQPGAALENGMAFCYVRSWITGRRLISLPFSDHCEPLVDNAADQQILTNALAATLQREKLKYFEVRAHDPLGGPAGTFLSTRGNC